MTTPGLRPESRPPAQLALKIFRERYGNAGRTTLTAAWAPGRVNLIGEHTDYNGGLVLPVAVDRFVALVGCAEDGTTVTCYSAHHQREVRFSSEDDVLLRAPGRQRLPLFARLIRGVLTELLAADMGGLTPAFRVVIAGDVPVGGGMSSSAAMEIGTATFAAEVGWPHFLPMETAQLCRRAEESATGVRVGIMDQTASSLGRAGFALLLDCRSLDYEYVPVELPEMRIAVFDTGVPHNLAISGYNTRRAECEAAVNLLAQAIERDDPTRDIRELRDIELADLERHRGLLSDVLYRRAHHVVTENARVLAAAGALKAGDVARLGQLITASHASLRDDYAVSCPELDVAVALACAVPGVLGARMMGAGFGGSALILAHRDAIGSLQDVLQTSYPQQTGKKGTLHLCRAWGGPQATRVVLDFQQ